MKNFFEPYIRTIKDEEHNAYSRAFNHFPNHTQTIREDFEEISNIIYSHSFDINRNIYISHYTNIDGVGYYRIRQDEKEVLLKAKTEIVCAGAAFSGYTWCLCFVSQIYHIMNMEKLASMFENKNIHFNTKNVSYLYVPWLMTDPSDIAYPEDTQKIKDIFTEEIPSIEELFKAYSEEFLKYCDKKLYKDWDYWHKRYNDYYCVE